NEAGPKLIVSGTVYKNDGVSPAPGVVLYVYHTDQKGLYPTKGNETGWGKRHGYLRGWIKTNEKGQYSFYTLRPASYPDGKNPQHIHATIKEPGVNEYWIDEFEFADDPYLTKEMQGHAQKRGGSGILTPKKINGVQYVERNITLGKNVPGYQ
ncbi:MAG: intradiol ring-cleavage dioxygenase, partial [Bacteroidota bacterium]